MLVGLNQIHSEPCDLLEVLMEPGESSFSIQNDDDDKETQALLDVYNTHLQ